MIKCLAFLVVFMVIGCQQVPTKVVTESGVLVERSYSQLLTDQTVVFDTRSPYEFGLSKIPHSLNLPVSDFVVEKDPMDAAKRLSLLGVSPETPVLIVGPGDQVKLAWEMKKLGLKRVEVLNFNVFKALNVRPEPLVRNVPLWKPSQMFGDLSEKDFHLRLENSKSVIMSKARSSALGNIPSSILKTRILVVTLDEPWKDSSRYPHVFERVFLGNGLFDSKGFLKLNSDWSETLQKYDEVYLLDSSPEAFAKAYALSSWGAKSLWIVKTGTP